MKIRLAIAFSSGLLFFSCASLIPASGPSTVAVKTSGKITVVNLTPSEAYKLKELEDSQNQQKISSWQRVEPYSPTIGKGDVLAIRIYETPPSVLLSGANLPNPLDLPPREVDDEGFINLPFIGRLKVAGKKPQEVASIIQEKLKSIAHKPQVIVQIVKFASSKVIVVGNVARNGEYALNYNNQKLLDILSEAGGVTSPPQKTIVKLVRGNKTLEIPLQKILENPSLNINLKPGDIVSVVYKTNSATFLGAVGKSQELEFEATGINLAQALGRVGGLNDNLAHAKGIFVFRWEDPGILKELKIQYKTIAPNGKVPVVYNIDLSQPISFFTLKNFELKNGDIVYVATAPAVQLGKFLGMIRDIVQPIFMVKVLTR